jgi:hypothetical protein
MIGVIANSSEHAVVREFFELFKTPWEFYRRDRRYEVLLCAGNSGFHETDADLVLIYASQETPFEVSRQIQSFSQGRNSWLPYKERRIPIYGESATFRDQTPGMVVDGEADKSILHLRHTRGSPVVRIGYDLFHEIRVLLTLGQPVANAGVPTLDLHIALLRDLIVSHGIELVEIPAVPAGHQFIACLTHDLDHPSIRRHKLDHTMFGFLYRSVISSLFNAVRGRSPWRDLLKNWAAAMKLPFVYLGLAQDFWLDFGRYTRLEGGAPSTFFVIPFRNTPGRRGAGPAPRARASRYGAADILPEVRELISAGSEIGLHGIDAWLDSADGRNELEHVRRITGMHEIGVRMHWLYFDEQSPEKLEAAGANYDSTVGYNETVGYRAGTTQVFKPLQAARLLELPLHIMDTALFFSAYLGLSRNEAREQAARIAEDAVEFGGAVTVNWHDRSIAPERLWGDAYVDIINDFRKRGAWFATAAQTISWFRKRRAVTFAHLTTVDDVLQAIADDQGDDLPTLQLSVYNRQPRSNPAALRSLQNEVATPV